MKTDYPSYKYKTIDGSHADNAKDFADAKFTEPGVWLFTATSAEGIQRYGGSMKAESIVDHIKLMNAPSNEHDLNIWVSEEHFQKTQMETYEGRPAFIKCFEQWCGHCKHLKKPFAQAATYFKGSVELWEVECSKTEASKAFCSKNGVQGYPTLLYFNSML